MDPVATLTDTAAVASAAPARRILLVQGHPDPTQQHLCHLLAAAYAEGARSSGHLLHTVDVGRLDFPLLRSADAWKHSPLPECLHEAQQQLREASHLVLVFPLWLGDMPALLKGFLEQIARPGFAFKPKGDDPFGAKGLTGRSARVVVTMGMPAALYRWFYRAHSVKSLERNILGFVGIAPVDETLIGGVDQLGAEGVARWQARLRALGAKGD